MVSLMADVGTWTADSRPEAPVVMPPPLAASQVTGDLGSLRLPCDPTAL